MTLCSVYFCLPISLSGPPLSGSLSPANCNPRDRLTLHRRPLSHSSTAAAPTMLRLTYCPGPSDLPTPPSDPRGESPLPPSLLLPHPPNQFVIPVMP